jgi:HlyD family secretion protein
MTRDLFRKEAVQRMQSPEDLQRLLVVVSPRGWLLLSVIAGLCLVVLVWSCVGEVPISVEGAGVLINPGNVQGIQSSAAGQVAQVHVRVGQEVDEGDLIAELSQTELQQQLDLAKARLPELERFHELNEALDARRLKLEESAVEEQTRFINEELVRSEKMARETNEASQTFTRKQRDNLGRTRSLLGELNKSLQGRVETIRSLRREGLSSDDTVLSARSTAMESELKIAGLEVQAQELELQEVRRRETEMQSQSRLADLKLQLLQLPIKTQQLSQQIMQSRRSRELEISQLNDRIETLTLELENQSKITSRHKGRVLEVAVSAGQLVGKGTRLATIDVEKPDEELMNLAFFRIRDGKRIRPGARVLVSPSNIERERYGSIQGEVVGLTPFPITRQGAVNLIGSEEIAEALVASGGAIEVNVRLETDSESYSGFKWTSTGPERKLTPGTTTEVRVIVERRAPITYLIPILKNWFSPDRRD